MTGSEAEIAAGRLSFRHVAAEDFARSTGELPFDLIVAARVDALDGRHPQTGARARPRLIAALSPTGRIFIDGSEIELGRQK
ncbi:hypothetical protein [Mesorhizobium ephedrae]|uniref:hypothetical protein n=1 Tax=Kumtagia ephedrae TaxID=2116701 RepID=UPI001FE18EBE|nr:hypothetical protein [Mesorhizobium ephedrae]